MKVLVVEDSPDVAQAVAFAVRMNWVDAEVLLAASGTEALDLFARHAIDLVVLDVAIPPPDGFEVCRRIRERSHVPILMLTIRSATADKVRALDSGADDYVTKPFDHLELLARLRALARRLTLATPPLSSEVVAGELRVNLDTHQVQVGDRPIHLTSTEFRLLEQLLQNPGTVLTHQELLEETWGHAYKDATHYLKVFVRRLRGKLGDDAGNPRYIETVRGVGYRFIAPLEQA